MNHMRTVISLKFWLILLITISTISMAMMLSAFAQASDTAPPIVSAPADANVIYGAEGRNILVSEDGGQRWEERGALANQVNLLVAANHDPNLVYAAATSAGVWRSEDGGRSWESLNEGLGILPGAELEVTALALDPNDDAILYAATGYWLGHTQRRFTPTHIRFSADGGQQWQPLAELSPSIERITVLAPVTDHPFAVRASSGANRPMIYAANAETLYRMASSAEAVTVAQVEQTTSAGSRNPAWVSLPAIPVSLTPLLLLPLIAAGLWYAYRTTHHGPTHHPS